MIVGALLSGCAHIDYRNWTSARTIEPFSRSFGIDATMDVLNGTEMRAAKVDGKLAYCTVRPVIRRFGEAPRGGSFFDTNQSGYFDKFYMLGTASIANVFSPDIHIAYVVLDGMAQPHLMVNPEAAAFQAAVAKRDEGGLPLSPSEVAVIARGEISRNHVPAPSANYDAKGAVNRLIGFGIYMS
jgi:hypothetical protein